MINIKDLTFSYTNKPPYLIENVNLDIPKGVYLSIIGENGSAKTTLVKLILGLLKPTSGTIDVNAKGIAYVPQKVESFNSQFPISVYEILKTHGNSIGVKNKSEIEKALEKVNMLEFTNKLIGSLSGGQQQRVFIGRALMGNPELIILDEPSTGVDFKNQVSIYALLSKLNKENGKTIISVEHNVKMALKYSTHILEVIEGTPTLYTIDEYLKHKDSLDKKILNL
ncbi:metal ABC transporter ATP-binding protein [Eubacterium multiforme]|uniref:Zinc transport system ATP-binding protein n=1 Tax=Eubacterium multiforme TaxID=83339 RepID=A0ABT9UTN2_9FIRM|nr:metal ABC transporter ATP-binding protein [Eubacterium multiforme]MDQ0149692.1 zinc transport system ATP-binding protein [Eubacterium multiforme]